MKIYETSSGKSYRTPFFLITSLFFLWGFAHAILEVLNPHFKQLIHLSNEKAAWVQAATYAAYFLMALPAGQIIRKYGYRGGVLTGLCLYGIGALLFLPICLMQGTMSTDILFNFFVGALFVLGCGLACLETSANPYVTVLGDPSKAESRINLSQSLNGLGQICGPLIGGLVFFGGVAEAAGSAESEPSVMSVAIPYTVMGIAVLFVALLFKRSELPEVNDNDESTTAETSSLPLYKRPVFIFGVICLGLYCAAQTGINANFIAYMKSNGMEEGIASRYLAIGGMGLFMLGRMLGAWLMQYIRAARMLLIQALGASVATLIVIFAGGYSALYALFFIYLMESIMFPTIFALSLRGLNAGQTKLASSILIMSIVLGGVAPLIMGRIADTSSIANAFFVPLVCYVIISAFSLTVKKV
ncbi:MAG: L-fucose:H+ symporter permease [Bacteroidales bacterium]|nr:L-fucose:H+ symporter permease [Candidatus Liminaster caballi]